MNNLPIIDITIIIVYLLGMLAIGFYFQSTIRIQNSLPKHPVKFPAGPLAFPSMPHF